MSRLGHDGENPQAIPCNFRGFSSWSGRVAILSWLHVDGRIVKDDGHAMKKVVMDSPSERKANCSPSWRRVGGRDDDMDGSEGADGDRKRGPGMQRDGRGRYLMGGVGEAGCMEETSVARTPDNPAKCHFHRGYFACPDGDQIFDDFCPENGRGIA